MLHVTFYILLLICYMLLLECYMLHSYVACYMLNFTFYKLNDTYDFVCGMNVIP